MRRRPLPTDDEVLATIERLALAPREAVVGHGARRLPGGCTSDIARALKSYPHDIKHTLDRLATEGKIEQRAVGNYRCYLPLTASKESAA